jgi:hypothetical protein
MDQTKDWLYVAAAIAAILAIWPLLNSGVRRVWNKTVGARRNQRRLIDRLFPGANLEYADATLGPAALISHTPAGTIRRYRLRDCWVSVGENHGAAEWVSVTITEAKFVLRTKRHTNGLIDIRLGRDFFDKASDWFGPAADVILGQKEQHYVEEVCNGSTQHRSQKAVLGYTSLGVGNLAFEGKPWSVKVLREKTTINSLAIARPFGDLPEDVFLGSQEVQAVPLGRRRAIAALVERLQSRRRINAATKQPGDRIRSSDVVEAAFRAVVIEGHRRDT